MIYNFSLKQQMQVICWCRFKQSQNM